MEEINQEQITPQEFSQKVKSKYPEYKDVDDIVLAKKMVEKYPEYANQVSFEVKKKRQFGIKWSNSSRGISYTDNTKKIFIGYRKSKEAVGVGYFSWKI
jgi:hypothetical protein